MPVGQALRCGRMPPSSPRFRVREAALAGRRMRELSSCAEPVEVRVRCTRPASSTRPMASAASCGRRRRNPPGVRTQEWLGSITRPEPTAHQILDRNRAHRSTPPLHRAGRGRRVPQTVAVTCSDEAYSGRNACKILQNYRYRNPDLRPMKAAREEWRRRLPAVPQRRGGASTASTCRTSATCPDTPSFR